MSSVSKVFFVCTLSLGLTACATPDYVFKKLDASQMDFQNDLNKCEDQAMTFGNVIRADYIKARNDCMIKKGWTLTNPR